MFITRNKTELGDAPSSLSAGYCFSGDKTTIRGFHMFNYQEAGREVLRGSTFLCLPVEQAFDEFVALQRRGAFRLSGSMTRTGCSRWWECNRWAAGWHTGRCA